MKRHKYCEYDYLTPPTGWQLEKDGWELVTILPYKDGGYKYYRAYYKREVTE